MPGIPTVANCEFQIFLGWEKRAIFVHCKKVCSKKEKEKEREITELLFEVVSLEVK